MIRFRDLLKIAPAVLGLGLFVGCGEETTSTPPSTTGEKVDKAIKTVEKAGDKAAAAVDKAGDKAVEAVKDAGAAVEKTADKAVDAVKDATTGEPPK